MLLKTFATALIGLTLSLSSLAETRYISDELYIYIHSGPSNKFRILGSVDAGEKVNFTDYDDATKYGKISLENGREGWVETKFLNRNPGLAAQLETAQQKLSQIEQQHQQQQQQLSTSNNVQAQKIEQQAQQLKQLQDENTRLNTQLSEVSDSNHKLQTKLDKLDEALLMKWFLYGGMVAGIGLILGLLLPLLPRKKKHVDRWM